MTGELPPEAEALVGAALRRWPALPMLGTDRLVPDDALRAVAVSCDLSPTGSGPLDGRTLVVKDSMAVGGVPMAVGSGLPAFVPSRDATVVARARAAGARVVAKAQCEAFLLGANSFSSRPEPVRNPYDPSRSAGGSSSGSAALVAARLADMAVGSDSAGSIRIPASFCGVVGLKPSRGRVPCTGGVPMEPTLSHTGPLAASVADVAALFAVIDGPDGNDPRQAWSRNLRASNRTEVTGLRIGVLEQALALADATVGDAIASALDRLEGAGAIRIRVTWPEFDETLELHTAIYVMGQALIADAPAGPPGFAQTSPDGWAAWRANVSNADLPSELLVEIAAGRALLARDPGLYPRTLRRADEIAADLDALFADLDVLTLPAVTAPPPVRPEGPIGPELLYGDTRMTAAFNVTGHPALSLPAGLADGLPVGLQLVAHRGGDDPLLAAAAAVEGVLGRLPPPAYLPGERL